MNTSHRVSHFHKVDTTRIEALFVDGKRHRAKLTIPFLGRNTSNSLCVIGQNPSDADEAFADKTVRYIEELIYTRNPEYSKIVVINLFSRVDKYKVEVSDLLNDQCKRIFEDTTMEHENILFIHGQLNVQGAYDFKKRLREIIYLFQDINSMKLNIGTLYAPHPRNHKINFSNFNIDLCFYDFSDV